MIGAPFLASTPCNLSLPEYLKAERDMRENPEDVSSLPNPLTMRRRHISTRPHVRNTQILFEVPDKKQIRAFQSATNTTAKCSVAVDGIARVHRHQSSIAERPTQSEVSLFKRAPSPRPAVACRHGTDPPCPIAESVQATVGSPPQDERGRAEVGWSRPASDTCYL